MIKLQKVSRRWNGYWFPTSSGLNLAICRIVIISASLAFFFPPLQTHLELLQYNDAFLNPPRIQQLMASLFGEQLWRSPQLFTSIHWFTVAAGLLSIVGFRTRPATAVFGLGFLLLVTHRWSYGAAMEIGPIKPMDTASAIFFLLLPLSPSGMRLSVDAWLARRRSGGTWSPKNTRMAMWTLRLTGWMLALMYLSAGWLKFANGGLAWFSGDAIVKMNFERGISFDLPIALWISQHQYLAIAISIMVVGFELLFVTGVLFPRTMPFWMVSGLFFHVSVFLIYENHLNFLSWVVLYVVYVNFEKALTTAVRNPRALPAMFRRAAPGADPAQ